MRDTKAFIGVLMLDTAFPRILGDAGNVDSYPFPVRMARVEGAGSLDVVSDSGPSDALTARFIETARALEGAGAVGLVSTCGFLVHRQSEIASAVTIPTLVSSLSLFPVVRAATGGRPVGILTASKSSLLGGTLQAAQIPPNAVRVAGFDDCAAFSKAILSLKADQPDSLDAETIQAYAVDQAKRLVAETPEIGSILLECGNLPPYTAAIRAAVRRPVFSVLDAAAMLWSGSELQRL